MGLKCSVLGHKYGDSTVERDREEQGSEVVITIQEVETCQRCGAERVVSENKEVTSIATPGDPVGPTYADDGSEPTDGAEEHDESAAETAEAVETTTESAVDETGTPAEPTGPDGESGTGDEADDDAGEPETAGPAPDEGAEILDAEADEPVADDELADPSVGEESATDEETEDAVIMGEDDGTGGDGRAPGEWPEEPAGDRDDDWSPADLVESDDEQTITAPDAGTEQNGAVTVPDGDFHCPECGYRTAVEASSLRAGDFCPDCRRGTLVHEPANES